MPARLENELKLSKKTDALIEDMPYYVKEWYSNLCASKKTASSRMDFVYKVRRFLKFIGGDTYDVSIDKINSNEVTNYYISIGTKIDKEGDIKETSDSYQQSVYCALKNFLGFLVKKGYIERNYILDIEKPGNNDLDRINEHRLRFTRNDFMKVIEEIEQEKNIVCRKRDLAMMRIFMGTGMRKTALMILNVSDIDFQKKTLVTVDKGAGKGKVQQYYLNSSTISALKDWLDYRSSFINKEHNSDALFVSYQGERLSGSGITKVVDKHFTEALGKHTTPHKIRGGVASILYAEKRDIEFVRRSMGHVNSETTQRYIATKNEERIESAEILNF